MVRVRHAVMAVALGTGAMGCALTQSPSNVAHYSIWHCDECDDFPTPAYGPGYSMMPGTYTRPPSQNSPGPTAATNGTGDAGAVPPPQQTPASTPPPPPAATPPGLGANAGAGAASGLPLLPTGMSGDRQVVPVANR